jgi:hypothetical protein
MLSSRLEFDIGNIAQTLARHAELVSASISPPPRSVMSDATMPRGEFQTDGSVPDEQWTLNQVQGDGGGEVVKRRD